MKDTLQNKIPPQNAATLADQPMATMRVICNGNGAAVAALGAWPAHIKIAESLTARIPDTDAPASGFDAGLATALGLMPAHAAALTATLHAAYTPAAVEQIRREIDKNIDGVWHVKNADSPTCWWLAACRLCIEGDDVDTQTFRRQLRDFQKLTDKPTARLAAANDMLNDMIHSFDTQRGFAFGTVDGAMQGAYIAGHDVAVLHHQTRDMFFIGTFRQSLGLEKFPFAQATDEKGRPTSGPVHGSNQFVKCATEAEMLAAMESVKKYFTKTPNAAKPPAP